MTAETASSPAEPTARPFAELLRSADPFGLAVGAIIVAQAAWLGTVMSRGWFYQDDLAYMSQATGRALTWSYLTTPVNDHLTPGLRFAFWLLHTNGVAHYEVTIGLRLLLQAAATALLARLLVRLVGPTRLVLVALGVYAFSPLLIGMVWLSSAMNVLPAQVLVLLALNSHLSFVQRDRLRYAAGTGFAFAGAAMFWELSAVDYLLLLPVSLGYLYEGPFRHRLGDLRRQWMGWLITAAPLALFLLGFLLGGYGGSARRVPAGAVLQSLWQGWTQTAAPMAVGGPWQWSSVRDVYFSATNPPTADVWISQAVFVAAIVFSVVRTGRRAWVAWSLPAITFVVASAIVTVGRFNEFGLLSAHTVTYAFDAALPLTLGVVLALTGPRSAGYAMRTHGRRTRLFTSGLIAVALAAALAGAVVSQVLFINRWSENPTRAYVETLSSQLKARPLVNLYDTPLPLAVLPFIEPNRYLSDVIPLLGRKASFDDGTSDPQLVDDRGHIVAARFVPAAEVDIPHNNVFCNDLVAGSTNRLEQFIGHARPNPWFLRLEYFQQVPSVIYVTFIDARGKETPPVNGSRVVLNGQVGNAYIRFPEAEPVTLRIRSTARSTNVCITAAQVGYPFRAAS